MDSKKIIEQLVKIAEKQQKIINKLAQQAQLAPPQQLPTDQPHAPQLAKIKSLVPPQTAKHIMFFSGGGNRWSVEFAPGQNTQANYNAVLNAIPKGFPEAFGTITLSAKEHAAPGAR